MKKVTMKDIANELGVTIGTVSHALNGLSDISEETKTKVFEAAKRMGYISNGPAASLRSGKTNTIAVIVPDISNPHIAHQIKLIDGKIKEAGYSTIIFNTEEDDKLEYNAVVTACSKQVDGILLCPAQHSTKNVEFLDTLNIPYVLIGRFFENFDTDFVCADDVKGGYIAGNYLIEKGCTNPVYIGPEEYIVCGKLRFEGLSSAYIKHGTPLTHDRYVVMDPKGDEVAQTFENLKKSDFTFDSVVAFSDLLAFKTISYLKKLYPDKNIPVIGFDAVNCHMFMPFYNVSIGMVEQGWSNSASILLAKIGGETKRFCEFIDVKLFEFNN